MLKEVSRNLSFFVTHLSRFLLKSFKNKPVAISEPFSFSMNELTHSLFVHLHMESIHDSDNL
jgi:hypothetical protein